MFGIDLIWLGVSGAAAVYGYLKSRKFVRSKLRFVDAIQNPAVPWVAGIATAIAASALSVLPLISVPIIASLIVGVGVGTGVLHGSRDVKRLPGG
jgi:hypothetical protein